MEAEFQCRVVFLRTAISLPVVFLTACNDQMLETLISGTYSCLLHSIIPGDRSGVKQDHKEEESGSEEDDDSDLVRNTNHDFDATDDESEEGDTSEEEDGNQD